MCYNIDDRPPDPPGAMSTAHGEDLVLTASDGNRFAAYFAHPVTQTVAEVLILPDVRGLHGFYQALARRFADVNIRALAIDYFGRTAGITSRDETFEQMPHVQQLTASTVLADITAGLTYLQTLESVRYSTFTLGFCMGGSISLLTGMQNFDLSGIIAFYAGLKRSFPGTQGSVLDLADKIHYPVLGLFGGADQAIPPEDRQKLDEQLTQAGIEHELVVYPGAPHSFFDRKALEYADASADAWKRVLNFIAAHSIKV